MDNVEEVQVIAIDIGFGDTKICTKGKSVKFPTAIERKQETFVEYSENINKDGIYKYNGKDYIVGERAINNAISTRDFSFLVKYSPLIIFHALVLAELDLDKPIKIVTGLSILNWNKKDLFLDSISNINVDDTVLKPSVVLMAQGQGVFLDANISKNGIVCIVDIGYNTFDFLVFEDSKPRQDLSFATNKGANVIITKLQTKLSARYEFDATEQKAKEVFLNGYVMHYNEKKDLTDEISEAKEDYAEFVMNELRSRATDLLRSASHVVFSGGGAYFLDKKNLPINCMLSDTPFEFANARGYYHAAN